MPPKRTRVNQQIRLPEILLIDEGGNKVGITSTSEALKRAHDLGLDLVEVAPNLKPPVCKILDFGKYQYEQSKLSSSHTHKRHKARDTKEIRLGLKIGEHDLNIKSKKTSQFLSKGNKVKITIKFKGRENAYPNLGKELINKFLNTISEEYVIDKEPIKQGRQMTIFISAKN